MAEAVEVGRAAVELRLDFRRAFQCAAAMTVGPRAELAIIAKDVLAPGVVGRLVRETPVHRLDTVERGPALERPFVQIAGTLGQIRWVQDYRLDQHRTHDQIRPPAPDRTDRGCPRGMAEAAHAAESHPGNEAFEIVGHQLPSVNGSGRKLAV